MRRLWLMLIVALLSLAACAAPPTQITQSSASPSNTTASSGDAATRTAEPTAEPSVAAEATASATAAPSTDEGTTPNVDVNSAAIEMVAALNKRRSENNCPELTMDDRLQQAAQRHAEDMASRRRIDHLSADGATLEQRLERAEYPFQRRAELLALGVGVSPATVVNQWLSEPEGGEHRGTVLDCEYRDVGVGIGTQFSVAFWVVNFGQQKP